DQDEDRRLGRRGQRERHERRRRHRDSAGERDSSGERCAAWRCVPSRCADVRGDDRRRQRKSQGHGRSGLRRISDEVQQRRRRPREGNGARQMKRLAIATAACLLLMTTARAVNTYSVVADWLKLPEGRMQLGNQHGDIAVSSAGEVYVSVQDPAAGLQVFSPEGKFLRNVNGAPSDFHGFVIHKEADGEFLYGATLRGQTIVKMRLDGTIIMTIGS